MTDEIEYVECTYPDCPDAIRGIFHAHDKTKVTYRTGKPEKVSVDHPESISGAPFLTLDVLYEQYKKMSLDTEWIQQTLIPESVRVEHERVQREFGDVIGRMFMEDYREAVAAAWTESEREPELEVRKVAAYIPFSDQLLIDYARRGDGSLPRLSRRERLRLWWTRARFAAGRRLGSWIVGEQLDAPHCEECGY